jgi:signal peptidase II
MLWYFFMSAVLILALDQTSKAIVVRWLDEGQILPIFVALPVRIRRFTNVRVRPRFFRMAGLQIGMWVFAVLGTIFLCSGGVFPSAVAHATLGAAVGGATGNLFDRLWRAGVVDFIDLRVWPVFNIADLAIVTGVGGAFLSVW